MYCCSFVTLPSFSILLLAHSHALEAKSVLDRVENLGEIISYHIACADELKRNSAFLNVILDKMILESDVFCSIVDEIKQCHQRSNKRIEAETCRLQSCRPFVIVRDP